MWVPRVHTRPWFSCARPNVVKSIFLKFACICVFKQLGSCSMSCRLRALFETKACCSVMEICTYKADPVDMLPQENSLDRQSRLGFQSMVTVLDTLGFRKRPMLSQWSYMAHIQIWSEHLFMCSVVQ